MTGYSYEPASAQNWLAVATAGRLLVARVADGGDRVGVLAATGDPETSVQQVLEVLTAQGLGATGPFALLFWVDGDLGGQGLGVIVRGDARVTVETADGPLEISSRGVTTWTEQVIENPTGFRVDVDDSAATAPELPLVAGAAWVSRIRLTASVSPPASGGQAQTPAEAPTVTAAPQALAGSSAPAHASPPATTSSAAEPAARESAAPDSRPAEISHEETRVFHTSTRTGIDTAQGGTEQPAAAAAEPEGYDYLFGATVFRPVGAAAGLPAPDGSATATTPDSGPVAPVPAFLDSTRAAQRQEKPPAQGGDHDGRTVLAADISAARSQARAHKPEQQASENPVREAPHSYVLELPDGGRQPLSAPVILGRAPSVSNVPASVLPHLVTLTGDDISRSHVRVAVEGDTVVVTDLHSSNGTHVIAPGKLPQLLRAGEPTPVITGTVIDLGSEIALTVSEA
ncbi:hypothetical protein IWX78_001963 [Mycetocola sp. CAN_C7]|uniref:FHA domain-containing protein n=1 Tax=Mycetocola sp. CAN_C7 TaxID=2787724 RepID=UPI0018CA6A58